AGVKKGPAPGSVAAPGNPSPLHQNRIGGRLASLTAGLGHPRLASGQCGLPRRAIMHIARNVQALRSAQVAWDNALPVASEDWIKTNQGAAWLDMSAEFLIAGHDVIIQRFPLIKVTARDFILEYSQAAVDSYGADDEYAM